tara:strand:+ start:1021 stop:1185 length:165 start_codon:yes stop_codon:yes gene_type:complete
MKDKVESVRRFAFIQIQVLREREHRLRKELQECLLQQEFLTQIAVELGDGTKGE